MKALERTLVVAVASGLAVVLALAVRERSDREQVARPSAIPAGAPSAADSAFADTLLRAAEDLGAVIVTRQSSRPAPERDPVRIADLLVSRGPETYLGEILAARDSMNFRWPERGTDPLRVWVEESELEDFDMYFPTAVREAFDPWMDAGIPVRFTLVTDSATADVHVTWVARYESRTSGRTRWVTDQHGWIVGGGIELALHQPDGRRLDAEAIRAIARHEVGHLLGLDHCADERNIMSARVRVTELSEADRATVRLVYALPPGSLKTR